MRINCHCGREINIRQKEVNCVIHCLGCNDYHILSLVHIENSKIAEYLKNFKKTIVITK